MPRVGRKRSDRRWIAPDGELWPSKFEWKVYDYLRASGANVRRCTESDSIAYCEPKPNVKCMECGSSQCGQDRYYTPDFYIVPSDPSSEPYYLEAKGYFRKEKRILFRAMRKARADIDVRVVFEADHWVTRGKTRISDYFDRFLKCTPYCVGVDNIPEDWL